MVRFKQRPYYDIHSDRLLIGILIMQNMCGSPRMLNYYLFNIFGSVDELCSDFNLKAQSSSIFAFNNSRVFFAACTIGCSTCTVNSVTKATTCVICSVGYALNTNGICLREYWLYIYTWFRSILMFISGQQENVWTK